MLSINLECQKIGKSSTKTIMDLSLGQAFYFHAVRLLYKKVNMIYWSV